MKKLIVAICAYLCVAMLFIFVAGATAGEDHEDYGHYVPKEREESVEANRMIPIETDLLATWAQVCVVYDSHTGVMYLVSRAGGVCPMIDADGRPLLHTP